MGVAIGRQLDRASRSRRGDNQDTASTSDVIGWVYGRRLTLGGERRHNHFGAAVRRALAQIGAVKVGRSVALAGRALTLR